MADRNALAALIEAVEAGNWTVTHWRDFAAVPVGDDDNPGPILAHRAYHGSLDAAKALHEALLPGWKVAGIHQEDSGLWWTELREGHITSYSRVVVAPHSFNAPNPARAWLLAVLRALAEKGE